MQDTPLETHEKSIKEMKNCLKNWMSQGSASEESKMSCKLSLISRAGGDRLWAGAVQSSWGVTRVTVPEPFLGTQQPLTPQGDRVT